MLSGLSPASVRKANAVVQNFDPLGIHTGDSIVVAPSQTLSDEDYNMLRTTAINVIRHLGVVGECNIQYALNPTSREYCIIEVGLILLSESGRSSPPAGQRAALAFLSSRLQSNWLPTSLHRGKARPRHPSERDQELGDQGHISVLRAEFGLCRRQDPSLGPQEVQPRQPLAQQQHEECW